MQEIMALKIQELTEESKILQVSRRRAMRSVLERMTNFTVKGGEAFVVTGRRGFEVVP